MSEVLLLFSFLLFGSTACHFWDEPEPYWPYPYYQYPNYQYLPDYQVYPIYHRAAYPWPSYYPQYKKPEEPEILTKPGKEITHKESEKLTTLATKEEETTKGEEKEKKREESEKKEKNKKKEKNEKKEKKVKKHKMGQKEKKEKKHIKHFKKVKSHHHKIKKGHHHEHHDDDDEVSV